MAARKSATGSGRKGKATKKTAKAEPKRQGKPATKREHPQYDLAPGTTLTRTFKGEDLEVHVTVEGFEYAGQTFKSISAVARHICGYQISGPVFFGLVETKAKEATS